MAELTAKERDNLRSNQFAYVKVAHGSR